MVAVAQLVEPWIVIPVVVGSSPISHPILHQGAAARLNCREPLWFNGAASQQAAGR